MNSHLLSDGKMCLVYLLVLFIIGCTTSYEKQTSTEDYEVSLKEDQDSLNELRKNIPPDIRARNDTLKLILAMMGELKHHPNKVRDKFNKEMRSRRSKFQTQTRKDRSEFSKNERKQSEKFLKDLGKSRAKFDSKKASREERSDFYRDQDVKRKEFFAEARDQRKEYENERQQQSKDFYAELRELQNEFNEEWRIYKKRWDEAEKAKRQERIQKQSGSAIGDSTSSPHMSPEELRDFQQMNQTKGNHLGTEDN